MKKVFAKMFGIGTIFGMVFSFSGCGSTSNNLGGATERYYNDNYDDGYMYNYDYDDEMYGNRYSSNDYLYDSPMDYTQGGSAYWDGYGINTGRPLNDNSSNSGSSSGYDYESSGGAYSYNTENTQMYGDLKKDFDAMGNSLADAGKDVIDGAKDMSNSSQMTTNSLVD